MRLHASFCAVCLLVFGLAASSMVMARVSAPAGNVAYRVKIAHGRKLYVQCDGKGSPPVLLEAGLRVRSDYWHENNAKPKAISVFPAVARFTRVCAYDRPGTVIGTRTKDRSRSDPVPMPRSAMSAVYDLHELIQAASIPRPLVLVGHSTGGLLIRLYAHTFPKEVAGLVLVDALPDGLQRDLTPKQYSTFLKLNTERPKSLNSYSAYETIPFDSAFVQLRRLRAKKPLAPMPSVVLSRGLPVALPPDVPAGFSKALERAWSKEQALLAKLQPRARQIIARRSEHYIMLEQPDLVITAIREVVDAVRHDSKRVSP